ncbi:MAG: hypothetical protein PUC00_12880 [Clostridiales bacterium]|nr:hypothetical protein [Clostridiales bacterium]
MVDWASLLGLPLEKAVERCRAWGCEPQVIVTRAPRRKGEEGAPLSEGGTLSEGGSLRVIRARENELTVSAFQDQDPRND